MHADSHVQKTIAGHSHSLLLMANIRERLMLAKAWFSWKAIYKGFVLRTPSLLEITMVYNANGITFDFTPVSYDLQK